MVYLLGASGHAKVVIEILEKHGISIGGLQNIDPSVKTLLGYNVHEKLPEDFDPKSDKIIISIGSNVIRKKLAESLAYNYISAIHPNVNISTRVVIGEGSVVMAGVSINSDATIGKHTIINTNASIDHDCTIGNYVHISPNAALAGNVTIEEGSQIGIGASIIQGVEVGKWCTIGAGSVIIKNIPDGAVVVGNPGRVIKILGER